MNQANAARARGANTVGGKVTVPVEVGGMGDPALDRARHRLTKAALFVAASFSAAVLLWAQARTSPRHERLYAAIAAALVVLVIVAATFAVYAESLGQRCFGPCG